ncbi:LysR family transcriptional regulator [Roseomonas sp. GC11]|uniref:LysR family transcriptional regulator n=1 Tax=Roseomonas sp. GC11 TaxID=2950546 RepID=UPI00210AD163|nr:LysR family transcriptional regulator [Roseomonas sp. GC11]MCQ4161597.1 LysR family transcriptional regulator [Roseomonas sp. GC11]
MNAPTLRQLRAFLAVVESGSISHAARALHLTQPAVSQQLRELERGLGARLLDRAAGRMIPSAAGTALLDPARRALAAATDAAAAVAGHGKGEAGRLRLGTGATACIHLLPPVLAALKQAMPGLALTVAIGNTAEVLPRLEAGELDAVLATLPIPASRALSVTRLFSDPLLALLPEAGAPAGEAAVTAEQLSAWPLILYEAGGNTRSATDAWFRRAGIAARPAMELGSVEAIKTLVGSGLGASVLPGMALRQPVPGAVIRPLRPAARRELGLVLRREKVLDRGLRLLLAALEEKSSFFEKKNQKNLCQGRNETPGA